MERGRNDFSTNKEGDPASGTRGEAFREGDLYLVSKHQSAVRVAFTNDVGEKSVRGGVRTSETQGREC